MSRTLLFVAAACTIASVAGAQTSAGQTGAAPAAAGPSHKHYEASEQAARPGPNGELAPRLQSLGSHVFPVSTKNADAQAFMTRA